MSAKVAIENINHPGAIRLVDRAKYAAVRSAMVEALQTKPKGLSFDDLSEQVARTAPDGLFPGGATLGWYAKAVQLDLEAKKVIVRTKDRPMRLKLPSRQDRSKQGA